MPTHRRLLACLISAVLVLALCSDSFAQFTAIQQTLFRDFEFAGNDNFLSSPQNGPLFNFNQYFQRLEYNRAGDGYTFEFFHFFGPDTFGNINTLDLGPVQLQLGPDPALGQSQLTGTHNRIGYTTRLIPEVFIQSETGQRAFNQFSGVSTFNEEPIQYRMTFNTGIQDFEWTGNAQINMDGRINILGFYDFNLRMTNVGNFDAGGVLVEDEQVTDFDIGPIDVSGNLAMDAIGSLFQGAGLDLFAVPPRILSGAAQKDAQVDELLSRLEAGESLTDEEAQVLATNMIVRAFETDPLGTILNGLPTEVSGFEGLSLETSAAEPSELVAVESVPETSTLCMLLLGAVVGLRRRRS